MQKIIGVKRYKDREIYYYVQNIDNLKVGDKVIVNFDDFQTVATVYKLGIKINDDKVDGFQKIVRKATESDIHTYNSLLEKAKKFLPEIKKKSIELGLSMKFVSAEYSLDNSKILIVFSSEDRVDFRQLLKELAIMLKIRIELKQIGQRDEVRICKAVGICGQQCCCSRFLDDFEHVTVKMAKTQGLSLSPTKINGVCGRLMCCLGYESEMYDKILEKMPKVGSEIKTPSGNGIVVYNDILREKVTIKRQSDGDSFVVEEFTLEELKTGKKNNSDKLQEKEKISNSVDEFLEKNRDKKVEKENNNVKSEQKNEKKEFQNNQKSNNKNVNKTINSDNNFNNKNKENKQVNNNPNNKNKENKQINNNVDNKSNGNKQLNNNFNNKNKENKQSNNKNNENQKINDTNKKIENNNFNGKNVNNKENIKNNNNFTNNQNYEKKYNNKNNDNKNNFNNKKNNFSKNNNLNNKNDNNK